MRRIIFILVGLLAACTQLPEEINSGPHSLEELVLKL